MTSRIFPALILIQLIYLRLNIFANVYVMNVNRWTKMKEVREQCAALVQSHPSSRVYCVAPFLIFGIKLSILHIEKCQK